VNNKETSQKFCEIMILSKMILIRSPILIFFQVLNYSSHRSNNFQVKGESIRLLDMGENQNAGEITEVQHRNNRSLVGSEDASKFVKKGLTNVTSTTTAESSRTTTLTPIECSPFGLNLHFSKKTSKLVDSKKLTEMTQNHLIHFFRSKFLSVSEVSLTPFEVRYNLHMVDSFEGYFSYKGFFYFHNEVPTQTLLDDLVAESFGEKQSLFTFWDSIVYSGDESLWLVDDVKFVESRVLPIGLRQAGSNSIKYDKIVAEACVSFTAITIVLALLVRISRKRQAVRKRDISLAEPRPGRASGSRSVDILRHRNDIPDALTVISEEDTNYFDTDFDTVC